MTSGAYHRDADKVELERGFHRAMVSIYERARDEAGYVATRFLQMISELGGLETARRLITSDTPSDGFTTLWEKGRVDLTVEAHVLQFEFRPLFTSLELRAAETRLRAYGYEPPEHSET